MSKIPKASAPKDFSRVPPSVDSSKKNDKVFFSFESVVKNEYFNLDGTCQNWAADLFETMQKVSNISIKDIHAGKYSREGSPLRIHTHEKAKPPCNVPSNVSLKDMWQIRISLSKGGIHGVFYDNIFYVIWFDPQHNLYPDKNHGGLKKVIPPSTCCKDRDVEIEKLSRELEAAKENVRILEELIAN